MRNEIFSEDIRNCRPFCILILQSYLSVAYLELCVRVESLAKRSPAATVQAPLANTRKKNLRSDGESGCG